MERFKIYLYTNLIKNNNLTQKKVLITDSEHLSAASTYNESFSLSENGQATLEFTIMEKLPDGKDNPYLKLIKPESVLGLHLPDREKNTENKEFEGAYYKLKVEGRTPSLKEENVEYKITSVDYARAIYAKQADGFEYTGTGTLREIAEDILGQTRKNVIYFDLNRDISDMFVESAFIKAQENKGFKYSLPYINYESQNMNTFINDEPYAIFLNNGKMENNHRYDVQVDVISSLFKSEARSYPLDFRIGIRGLTKTGQETFSSVTGKVINFEKAVSIRFPFTFLSNSINETERMEITIHEILDPVDGSPWPTTSGIYSISMANFKITKSRGVTEENLDTTALRLNHLGNFKQFMNKDKGTESYIKMTFSTSNANLYSSLVSLATLFNGEVRFDYVENAFYFVSKDHRQYKGYHLHPDVNLDTISRPEDSTEFATIFHLEGDGDVDGAMPALPVEWRRFLSECVDKGFPNEKYFKNYGGKYTYDSFVEEVYKYKDSEDSADERLYEIEEFAKHMDKIPNFESTIYDFTYFKNTGALGTIGNVDYYQKLMEVLYDNVRKLNISLNINTYRYYLIYSTYTSQLTQIAFYVSMINAEEKLIYNSEQKLDPNNPNAPDKYTSSWVSYMNAIDSAKANIANFKAEMNTIVGIDENGNLDVKSGSFVYNSCMLFGYKNKDENGIQKLLDENATKINEKVNSRTETLAKIAELEKELDDPNTTKYVKESLAVELAGLRSNLDTISRYLGIPNGNRGTFLIESGLYGDIKTKMANKKVEINEDFIRNGTSLFTLLYDRESTHNLVNKKEKELEILMDEYETFALEARYQNSEEVTAKGLLDQGLSAFTKFNRPKVSYSISSIHIGALKEYSYYKHPEVGDKVTLEDGLYLSYQDHEETKHIVIVGYTENLREPDSVKLTVEVDDESEVLVRRMLEKTNFVTVGKEKTRSNYSIAVPNELKNQVGSVQDSIDRLHETELSVSNMFDRMLNQ